MMHGRGPSRGCLRPTFVAAVAVLLIHNKAVVGPADPRYIYSPSPPPYIYRSPLLPSTLVVTGEVHCCAWKRSKDSSLKKPLEGAVVRVTCKANYKYVGFGETNIQGKYSIEIIGYPYWRYGSRGCKVKLHSSPKGSLCNVKSNPDKPALLQVYAASRKRIVLRAKPLALLARNHMVRSPGFVDTRRRLLQR